MALTRESERRFLEAVAKLAYCNHFLPERIDYEKAALGGDFVPGEPVWSVSVADPDASRPNVKLVHQKLQPLLEKLRVQLERAPDIAKQELAIYEDCVHQLLYQRYYSQFRSAEGKWRFYRDFLADWNHYFSIPGKRFETALEAAHVFACFR